MATFTGLGQALGSAAAGFGRGEIAGEQTAYNRLRNQQGDEYKRLLAQLRSPKPAKEELPFEVKTLLETRARIMGPGADYQERNDWQASGQEAIAQGVIQALAQGGGEAARKAYAIMSAPPNVDVSSLIPDLQQTIARNRPAAAAARTPQQRADDQAGPSPDVSFAKPMGTPFTYSPTAKEQAQTGKILTDTWRIQELTPQEVFTAIRTRQKMDDEETLARKQFNLRLAEGDWKRAYETAQLKINTGFQDLRMANQFWSQVLDTAVRTHLNGGNAGDALKPLLTMRGAMGNEVPNVEAMSRYLAEKGLPQGDIQAIIQGATAASSGSGGTFTAPAAGGPTLGAAPTGGGPPVLPPVGAQPSSMVAGSIQDLDTGMQFAQAQGFKVTAGRATSGHNPGSKHYSGQAFDVGVRGKSEAEIQNFIQAAQANGLRVVDERTRPPGQKVWGGPHLHLEVDPNARPAAQGQSQLTQTTPGTVPSGATDLEGLLPGEGGPPRSPYAANTLEGEIWNMYTSGTDAGTLQRRFQGTKYEQIAADVIDRANERMRARRYQGAPVADRFGARVPEGTNFAGTLGYPEEGIPEIETASIEPNAGFGGRPPAAAPGVIRVPGVPTGAEPPPETFPTSPYTPPAQPRGPMVSGPPLTGAQPMLDLRFPNLRMPDLGMPKLFSGPSVFGAAPPQGGGATGPTVPTPTAPTMASEPRLRAPSDTTARGPEAQKEIKVARQEMSKFSRLPYAAGVLKWLKQKKIVNPVQQREVANFVTGQLVPEMLKRMTPAQVKNRVFQALDQNLKPGR